MMILRGKLEQLVRDLRAQDLRRGEQVRKLWAENDRLRGQVYELEQTLGRRR